MRSTRSHRPSSKAACAALQLAHALTHFEAGAPRGLGALERDLDGASSWPSYRSESDSSRAAWDRTSARPTSVAIAQRPAQMLQPGRPVAEGVEVYPEAVQRDGFLGAGAGRARDGERLLGVRARARVLAREHQHQAKRGEGLGALGRGRVGGDQRDGALEAGHALGRAPELPQEPRPLLQQRRDALGLGGRLAERDRGIDELDGLGGSPSTPPPPPRARAAPRARCPRAARRRGPIPQREGAPVVLGGLGERADALGLGARAHRGGQRARLVAGARPVVGDLGRDRRRVAAGEVGPRLQRGGERGVHTRPLAGQQLAVGGLAARARGGRRSRRRTATSTCSRTASRSASDSSGSGSPAAAASSSWCTSRPPTAATRTTACARGSARGCAPAACRAASRAAARRPPGAAATSSSAKNGLPSERAKTASSSGSGGASPRIPASCSSVWARVRRSSSSRCARAAVATSARKRRRRSRRSTSSLRYVATTQDALVAQPAREVGQQLERRAIGPVDVLDDEQDRRGRRRGGEAVEDERVKAGGWPLGAHGRKPVSRRSCAPSSSPRSASITGSRRDRRLVEPDALPGEDLVAVGAGVRDQLGDEPALAHAGLAADEHEARRARARPRHRGDELAQLVRAADEDGARDARRHRPSIAPRGKYVAGAHPDTSSYRCGRAGPDLPSTHRFLRQGKGLS